MSKEGEAERHSGGCALSADELAILRKIRRNQTVQDIAPITRRWHAGCNCEPGKCKTESARRCADWTKRNAEQK